LWRKATDGCFNLLNACHIVTPNYKSSTRPRRYASLGTQPLPAPSLVRKTNSSQPHNYCPRALAMPVRPRFPCVFPFVWLCHNPPLRDVEYTSCGALSCT
jgi:hypothetical protein